MQQGAFAAAGRATKRDRLAGGGMEIHTIQDRDHLVVVAFPHAFSAQDEVVIGRSVGHGKSFSTSFKAQGLHGPDTDGINRRIQRAGDARESGEHHDSKHHQWLDMAVDIAMEHRHKLQGRDDATADQ